MTNQLSGDSVEWVGTDRVRWVHRIVMVGMLVSLWWKHRFFRAAAHVYLEVPLADDFFPAPMQSAIAGIAAFLGITAACVGNIMFDHRRWQIFFSLITLGGVTFLCVHQATYNDATFTTMWWTAVWALWLVARRGIDDSETLLRKAAFLSRLIVSMILLAGGVGKWTSEYWSGLVLHDIYFVDRNFWLFNGLRDRFDAAQLREMATHYSRFVVISETVAGLGLWLLPARLASVAGIGLLCSIALMSNFLLFSVMGCLIGMLASGLFVPKKL